MRLQSLSRLLSISVLTALAGCKDESSLAPTKGGLAGDFEIFLGKEVRVLTVHDRSSVGVLSAIGETGITLTEGVFGGLNAKKIWIRFDEIDIIYETR